MSAVTTALRHRRPMRGRAETQLVRLVPPEPGCATIHCRECGAAIVPAEWAAIVPVAHTAAIWVCLPCLGDVTGAAIQVTAGGVR